MKKVLRKQVYQPDKVDGFTLIEVLVVIVMIAILSAVAVPSWQSFLSRQRMNAVRTDLMRILKNAQDEAQGRQQSKQVTFLAPIAPATTSLAVVVSTASASTSGITTVLGNGEITDKFNLIASTPIIFDHDGRVDVPTPYVIKIIDSDSAAYSSSPPQSCVIVTTLLGGLKAANNDVCDNF